MVKVCGGESGFKQWHKDGSVVRGVVDKDDTGLCQINNRFWGAKARELGLNYKDSIIDNVKMTRHIYDTEGVTMWVYYNDHLANKY
jgi:hypothetical protein